MVRSIILLSLLASVAAFVAPKNSGGSSLNMMFNFGKKAAPKPVPAKSVPVSKVAPKVAPKPVPAKAAPKPVPAKAAPAKAAPVKAVPKPVPAKAAPVSKPVPKVAPKPAISFFKPAPAAPKPAAKPVFKPTPVPVKKAAASVASFAATSGFAGGLVGSDVEAFNFDPLELSKDRSPETLAWYRAAELKHARICMLAALGLSVQPAFHLPDPVFDSTAGYGVVAKLYNERPEAIWQILLALAAIETFSLFKNGQGAAGDLGFDPLDLKTKLGLNADPAKFSAMQLKELKNGRLAMLGTSALLLQEYVSGGFGPYEQLFPHN